MNQKQMGECQVVAVQPDVEQKTINEHQISNKPQQCPMVVEPTAQKHNSPTTQAVPQQEAKQNASQIVNQIITSAVNQQHLESKKQPMETQIIQESETIVKEKPRESKYILLKQDQTMLQSLKSQNEPMQNIQFYLDQRKATYKNLTLTQIHNKKNDYEWMEDSHDYIQWLFPNHYKSRFNYKSQQLTIAQARYFRQSRNIGERMIMSFRMFLNFMGIRTKIPQAKFKIVSMDRLKDALVHHTHNHLRLRRIMASLSVTGFRMLAQWLVNILDHVIEKYAKELKKSWTPLRTVFNQDWRIYSDENLMTALENCMPETQQVFKMVNPAFEWAIEKQLEFTKKEHLTEVTDGAT